MARKAPPLLTRFVKKGDSCPSGMVKVQPTAKMKAKGMDKRADFCAKPELAHRKGWREA